MEKRTIIKQQHGNILFSQISSNNRYKPNSLAYRLILDEEKTQNTEYERPICQNTVTNTRHISPINYSSHLLRSSYYMLCEDSFM